MEAITANVTAVLVLCWLLYSAVECQTPPQPAEKLQDEFYRNSCPQVEDIIAISVEEALLLKPSLGAALIRLHFHDCFVNGCDGSILLDETSSGEAVEKTSPANGDTLRGLKYIDRLKADIEGECPGAVSCADILAYAAREAVVKQGLPYYTVPGGRRDGLSSSAQDVLGNLPSPGDSMDRIIQIFNRKGFSIEDMVVLSGAHSIGHTHCINLSKRLYSYSTSQAQDPSMDFLHSLYLQGWCPRPGILPEQVMKKVNVPLEPITPLKLDTYYYTQLLLGKGVLQSDQALANDPNTTQIVERLSQNPSEWAAKFTNSMINLGKVEVLTGNEGEIRRNCRAVN